MKINESDFIDNFIISKFKNSNNFFEFAYNELHDVLCNVYNKGYEQGAVDAKYDNCTQFKLNSSKEIFNQIPIPGLEEF